jgi:hypothetical protein
MQSIVSFTNNIKKEDQEKIIISNGGIIIRNKSELKLIVSGTINFYMKLRDIPDIECVNFAVTKEDKNRVLEYVKKTGNYATLELE